MNKNTKIDLDSQLLQSKANIYRQASMAIISIIVCFVLCFALTIAWYTNTLHTSDLAFKAKDWDFKFEGNITFGNGNIYASPGESGVIPLSLKNASGPTNEAAQNTDVTTIGVKVNIDKSNLSLFEPRLYFYVDDQQTINDEIVEKQYITTNQSYIYTVFPGQELKISDKYSNQPQLRWEWVYDVLGYYVYADMKEDKTLDIIEYIRPIEYNTDKAVYDTKGKLVSIDGVSVDTFILENYLKKDGFDGPSDDKVVKENGYYKVSENIYIKLCTQKEIEENNIIDTAFATGTSGEGYPARIILTGQKANVSSIYATTSGDIADRLNKGYDVIKLDGNTTLVDNLVVEKGTNVTIDLNGMVLTQDATITANEGSCIGFINGTIKSSGKIKDSVLINGYSSEIYFDNVKVEDFYSGIEIYDGINSTDSYICISNSEFITENSGVWLRGNGDLSGRKTTVVIEGCKFTSTKFVPVGVNGSYNMSGMETIIENSTLTGLETAVYHPATQSKLTISNSTLKGNTGLVIKGGNVIITDTTIQGIGPYKEPELLKSGFSVTGDGIYIEDNYVNDNNYECTLTINGSNTNIVSTSDSTKAIRVFEGTSNKVGVLVNAGQYSSDVGKFLPRDNSKVITESVHNKLYIVSEAPAN